MITNCIIHSLVLILTFQVICVVLVDFDSQICESLPKFNDTVRQQIADISGDIQKIIDFVVNGTDSGVTYNELAKFVDQFGPRFVGTKNLEDSIDYMVDLLTSEQHDKVYTENLTVPVWIRDKEWAQMISPRIKPLNILGLGYSVGTNGSVVTGDVMIVKTFDELDRRSNEANGKFVVYNFDYMGYEHSTKYRGLGAKYAAQYGAIGALIKSITPFSIETPHAGAGKPLNDINVPKIPAVSITIEDAELFERLTARGLNVTVSLYMEAHMEKDGLSRNTISEITGTVKPEEIVIISGHLDSWDVGQGAMDDGGGAFISWRALSVIKKLGLRPKRTMRSVLWTGEEMGFIGVEAYVKQHINELNNISIAMESDSGTFTPKGIGYSGQNPMAQCIISEILKSFKSINATNFSVNAEVSDIFVLQNKGVPVAGLTNHNDKYFYFHHTSGDTMTLENSRDLDLCTAVWAATSYALAAIDDQLPR